ncbi:hypothetical protein BGX38DRAFT_1144126 [Terfezia claveryi]|nr:hypothetical protein BGX38DRAFT_1144126 [Terfezia claveryi]
MPICSLVARPPPVVVWLHDHLLWRVWFKTLINIAAKHPTTSYHETRSRQAAGSPVSNTSPADSSPLSPKLPSALGTPQTPTPTKKRVRALRVQIPVNIEVQEVSGDEDCTPKYFEAILLQFLEFYKTKGIVNRICFSVRERGVECIGLESPCISPREICSQFLKNNIKLISDVWYPIMDVAPQDFLLTNGIWVQCFLDATCVVLVWMVTHFFGVEKVEEKMGFELGKCPITSDAINSTIAKADGTIPSDFYIPNKPLDWKQRKSSMASYGELKFIKIVKNIVSRMLEEDIEREINDPESELVLPCQPLDFKEVFEYDGAIENTLYWVNVINTHTMAVWNIEAQAKKVREDWEEKAEKALGALADHKLLLDSPTRERQQRIVLERFLVEYKELFYTAEACEKAVRKAGVPFASGTGGFSTTEVLGGFAAYLGLLKKEGWFEEVIKRYDMGGLGMMGTGAMSGIRYYQGNQMGCSNNWGDHSEDMGNQQLLDLQHHMQEIQKF